MIIDIGQRVIFMFVTGAQKGRVVERETIGSKTQYTVKGDDGYRYPCCGIENTESYCNILKLIETRKDESATVLNSYKMKVAYMQNNQSKRRKKRKKKVIKLTVKSAKYF